MSPPRRSKVALCLPAAGICPHKHGTGLTGATFNLGKIEFEYVRLTITDAEGQEWLWSNISAGGTGLRP